ncbi:MAG: RICIN domain-containing protein, partial [Hominilimicola sp.]
PPWFMTISGCSGGGVDAGENLDPSKYDDFASFVGNVTEHFEEIGLKFDSYSPMNEPSTQKKYWSAQSVKQEGNHVAPGEHQSGIINALSKVYDERGIDTMVVGLDETSIDYSITSFNDLNDTAKKNLDRFDTHSYEGSKRAQLKQTAIDAGKNLWMSEVDNGKTAGTNPGNMGMALALASHILNDINGMQPSAWVMWDILDFHKDSQFTAPDGTNPEADNTLNQDGGLWGVGMVDHDNEKIELTQKYYGYGQFTKYIEPGMTIIASSDSSVAAYDKKTGKIVIVAVNFSNADKLTEFDLREFAATGASAQVIRTSGSYESGEHWEELEPIPVSGKEFYAPMKANSITTFVIEGADTTIDKFEISENGSQADYSYSVSEVLGNCDKYFAVYDKDGVLKAVTLNQSEGTLNGDFANCTPKLMVWDGMKPAEVKYMTINGSTSLVTGVDYSYKAYVNSSQTPADVTWSVSDETIASVTADGILRAVNGGNVTLTATTADGMNTSIDINVIDAASNIRIVNKKSGLGLETKSKGITSGTQLVQWEYRGLDTSAWKLSSTDDGYFNITNVNGDMLLAANADQKPVITSDVEATDDSAKWELINHNGYYEIKSVSAQKSIDVSGQSTSNGGNVILYSFSGGDNQLWSFGEITGELEHVVPEVVDYSKKYDGTDYTFVSNVDAATNDFNDGDPKGFAMTGFAGLGSDNDGEAVLLPQNSLSNTSNTQRAGTATLTLDTPVTCVENQIINLSFDMFAPNSDGDSDFKLSSSDGTELVKITVSNWGGTYSVTIGNETVENAGDGTTYFKNNIGSKVTTSSISNGGHVEVYYMPSTGDVKVTVNSVSNTDAVLKTYTGTADADKDIGSIYFAGTYTQWNKIMVVDNLITNIITEK